MFQNMHKIFKYARSRLVSAKLLSENCTKENIVSIDNHFVLCGGDIEA